MSFEADSTSHEQTLEDQNKEIIALLKALIVGIEIISDQEIGSLIKNIEG